MSSLQTFPKSYAAFRESMISWLNEKLWIKGRLLTKLGIEEEKLLFVEHHMSHAASAFYCSPFKEAAILTVDGVGEWTTAAFGRGTAYWEGSSDSVHAANRIELWNEIQFPHSLGLLYSAFTAFLGFRVNSDEYKVMGMAPYGVPNRVEDVYKAVQVGDDGSLRLNMEYFSFHHSRTRSFSEKFVELFGQPRVHESNFYTSKTHPRKDHPDWNEGQSRSNQSYADIAASIQRVTEDTLIKMAAHTYEVVGSKNLCMAGGVALNSVANGRILFETPFENLFIQPAAGDSGGALGAALYVYHVLLGRPRRFVMEHAYWGESYSPGMAKEAAEAAGYAWEEVGNLEQLAELMIDDLVRGRVIALFQNRFEWGPRALGNRSILADPRRAEMKEIVNARIKFREPFRPFAPVVLEERVPDFYEGIADAARHYPLRFMLMVLKARDVAEERIPAVTHVGGTGRVQTIRKEWNPLYHRVVEAFGEVSGIPVVLNTSFNLRGEPIVNTPADAMSTFGRSGLDTLYIDGLVIRK